MRVGFADVVVGGFGELGHGSTATSADESTRRSGLSDQVIAQAVPEINFLLNQWLEFSVQQLRRWADSKVLGGCCWGNSALAAIGRAGAPPQGSPGKPQRRMAWSAAIPINCTAGRASVIRRRGRQITRFCSYREAPSWAGSRASSLLRRAQPIRLWLGFGS